MKLASDAIAITGLGLQSSMGNAVTACAAARAGMSRAREIEGFEVVAADGTGAAISGHAVAAAAGFRGFGKLLCLAWPALEDLLSGTDLRAESPEKMGLHLCLPDLERPDPGGPSAGDAAAASLPPSPGPALCERLTQLATLPLPPGNWSYTHNGHAGVACAIADASAKLKTGALRQCLVGGVESLLEDATLEWLLNAGWLKTPDKPDGIQPGEAGVFVLLERLDVARQRKARVLAAVAGAAVGKEPDHVLSGKPAGGEGLAQTASRLFSGVPAPGAAPFLLSDHNGTFYRGCELGNALIRLSRSFPEITGAPRWYPAESFGDTGAASAGIAICMAAQSLARGYAPAGSAFILSSSDRGARAALHVQRAEGS